MSEASLQPAYVLHTRRFRESSLIVEFLTREHGRTALLAKGAMGGKGGRQGLLQPFSPLMIAWRGRGELPTLTTLEAAAPSRAISGTTLFCGMYVNELLLKLMQRGESHGDLFAAYARCMQDLIDAGNRRPSLEAALRRFEVRLLEELGVGMSLGVDQQGEPVQADTEYEYDVLSGPLASARSNGDKVSGSTLLALAHGEFESDTQRNEARRLMRRVLAHHLDGQRLRSRELFRSIGG